MVIIGGGTMGEALGSALHTLKCRITIIEKSTPRRQQLAATYTNVTLAAQISEIDLNSPTIMVLAVKPQDFDHVAPSIVAASKDGTAIRLLSIMAGISIEYLQQQTTLREVGRAMPNVAAKYSAAAIGLSFSGEASSQFQQQSTALLGLLGPVYPLPEHHLHTITGLSGSGIAFILQCIHTLSECGQSSGLKAAITASIMRENLRGILALLESNPNAQEWIAAICSPNGTTMAGMAQLEEQGFNEAITRAFKAVINRSKELGK